MFVGDLYFGPYTNYEALSQLKTLFTPIQEIIVLAATILPNKPVSWNAIRASQELTLVS